MRLWRRSDRSDPVLPVATNAVPPTYTSVDDFIRHALRYPQNGWFEALPGYAGVGTVARCLQLVCQQVATLPLRFRGSFEPLWVSNPDPVWFPGGIGDAVFAATYSMYAYGDAFLWVTSRYETGFPRSWTVLDPQRVDVTEDPAGGRFYRVNQTPLDADDVLQITRDPRGGLRGTSALEGYAGNVAAAAAAERLAADMYTGGVPWAILQVDRRNFNRDQANQLKEDWLTARADARGAPAVLPQDVALTEFAFNPKDLALLDSREWDAKQIAAAFGVPAFMLNMEQAGGLNYSNPEMLFSTWWRSELYPAAKRIATHLSTWVPRGAWVEFDGSDLLRPDLATETDVWLKLLAAGVVTVNEVRAKVPNLPPLDQGEAVAMIEEPSGAKANQQPPPAVPQLEVIQG
jgi:HK97 family phage portal protein